MIVNAQNTSLYIYNVAQALIHSNDNSSVCRSGRPLGRIPKRGLAKDLLRLNGNYRLTRRRCQDVDVSEANREVCKVSTAFMTACDSSNMERWESMWTCLYACLHSLVVKAPCRSDMVSPNCSTHISQGSSNHYLLEPSSDFRHV